VKLFDCNASASAFPIEYNGLTLKEISDSLTKPFGISSSFVSSLFSSFVSAGFGDDSDPLNPFERVAPKASEKIYSFLARLAKQRNQIISNDVNGDLVYQASVEVGDPVAKLIDGSTPLISITANFDEQNFYSSITGISPSNIGDSGQSYTVNNPFLEGVFRPFTFGADDTDDSTLKAAVEYKAGLMVANAIKYEVVVNTWRDTRGDLWRPNTTIVVNAPSAMIYKDFEFIIAGVNFARGVSGDTAVLSLVLPGAYSGEFPRSLPWL